MSDGLTNLAMLPGDDARATIVAAAEALYRRGGADAVTLSAVARETDVARGVIYSHFASRQDLIAAVKPPDSVETPSGTKQTPSSGEKETAATDSYDSLMQAQAEALQQLSKQVIVPKPRQRAATDAALSRLDARIAVTEQSLAALDQRVGERLKSLDVDTGALAERLHGLRQRLEKFEEKQTAALAQLRLDVHNLGHAAYNRSPEVLAEAAAAIAPAVEPVGEAPEEMPVVETAADVPAEAPVDATLGMAAVPEPAGRMADYLVSARRAAHDASVRKIAKPSKRKSPWKRFLGKRRWVILAAAAVLVAWFDTYVFAHYQPAQGAVVPVAVPVPPQNSAKQDWSPRAQLVRGLKYLNGTGVPVDLKKARVWIERAALRHYPVAENLMGVLYQTGTGVAVDVPRAIGWYEGAARHGNLKAMTNLGKLYAGGWPSGTNFAKASEWFAKAAAYGDVDAAFDLAVLYERGLGVARNLPAAYKWYAIAAARGDAHAASRAATLTAELVPEEREAADAAVAAFKPQTVDGDANEAPPVAG